MDDEPCCDTKKVKKARVEKGRNHCAGNDEGGEAITETFARFWLWWNTKLLFISLQKNEEGGDGRKTKMYSPTPLAEKEKRPLAVTQTMFRMLRNSIKRERTCFLSRHPAIYN